MPEPAASRPPSTVKRMPRIDSESLLGAAKQAVIVHRGQYYLLRATRNGKLILNK